MKRDELLAILGPEARAHVEKQLAAQDKARGPAAPQSAPKGKKRMGGTPVWVDEIRFPSKLEASYYRNLVARQKAGQIKRFHRQVIFDVGGGRRLFVDFMVIHNDGRIEYVETKGYAMDDYLIKRDIAQALYGIKITEINL